MRWAALGGAENARFGPNPCTLLFNPTEADAHAACVGLIEQLHVGDAESCPGERLVERFAGRSHHERR